MNGEKQTKGDSMQENSGKIDVLKIFVAVVAGIYAIAEAFLGLRFLALPKTLAALGFPYSQIAELPQFLRPVNTIGTSLLVLSVLFVLAVVLLFLKAKIGRIMLLVASGAQILFLAILTFFFISKVIPLASEVSILFGVTSSPWYLIPSKIIILAEAIALIPEAFIVLAVLKPTRDRLG